MARTVVPSPGWLVISKRPGGELDPFAHPQQSEALAALRGVESGAVVGDDDRHRAVELDDLDPNRLRVGVRHGVVERLLDEAVDRRFQLGLVACGMATFLVVEVDVQLDGGAVRVDAVHEPVDCRLGPELVEGGGAQLGDQRAQVADLVLDLVDGGVDGLLFDLLRFASARGAQADDEAGKAL